MAGKSIPNTLFAAVFASFVLYPTIICAEPYIAIREGMACSQCHANMTGGGKRNTFGNIYTQSTLPMKVWAPWQAGEQADEESIAGLLDNKIGEYLSFGANFRTSNVTTSQPSGGGVPALETNQFQVDEALLYVEADLIADRLILYFDQRVAPGAATAREAFALVKGLPLKSYVKAGRFFQPYGLRLQDDSAFVRSQTGVNFNNSDIGVELGMEPGPISASIAITNGTNGQGDSNVDKRLSGLIALIQPWGRIGASGAYNKDPGGTERGMWNVFGGLNLWRLTFLGEFDHVRSKSPGRSIDGIIGLAELNALVMKGLNAKATYEFFDPDIDVGDNARTRYSLVLEAFPTQFSQIRAGGRIGDGPQQIPTSRVKEFFVQLHLFF